MVNASFTTVVYSSNWKALCTTITVSRTGANWPMSHPFGKGNGVTTPSAEALFNSDPIHFYSGSGKSVY